MLLPEPCGRGDPALAAWDAERWFLVSCVCSLIAELLHGSYEGEIFPARLTTRAVDVRGHGRRLKALRNACFHPAQVKPDPKHRRLHADILVEELEKFGEYELAERLRKNYAELRSRNLAKVALGWTNAIGKTLAGLQ